MHEAVRTLRHIFSFQSHIPYKVLGTPFFLLCIMNLLSRKYSYSPNLVHYHPSPPKSLFLQCKLSGRVRIGKNRRKTTQWCQPPETTGSQAHRLAKKQCASRSKSHKSQYNINSGTQLGLKIELRGLSGPSFRARFPFFSIFSQSSHKLAMTQSTCDISRAFLLFIY